MTKQIDELMALARQWVEARTKGQGGSSQQDALRQALEAALNNWKHLSITEIAAENHSAMEYCKHWEDRALTAEAALKPGEDDEPYECPVCGELDPCTSCGDPHCGLIAPPAQTPEQKHPFVLWGEYETRIEALQKEVVFHKELSEKAMQSPPVTFEITRLKSIIEDMLLAKAVPPAQTPPKQEPRTGVWGYIDAQVARDMQGFYEAFGTATPPTQTPKGLFVDLITQHHGLAEELKAIDDMPMPTWTPPPRLTDEQLSQIMEQVDFTYAPTKFARAIETAVRRQFGVQE